MGHADDVTALEANAWSIFSIFGTGPGGRVIDTPSRLLVESPVRQPPYNSVLRFEDEGDRPLVAQIDEVWSTFRARSVDPIWLVNPSSPEELRPALSEYGLIKAEDLFGMAAPLAEIAAPPEPVAGVDIIEAGADEADDWLHLISWRYGLDTTHSPYLTEVFAGAIGVRTRVWLARIDGRPVSKVAVHLSDSDSDSGSDTVAGVYGVATTESGRGKGLATVLTLIALQAARASGATSAVLHSTPMAHGLYERMGFRDVAPFEVWAEPDTLHL